MFKGTEIQGINSNGSERNMPKAKLSALASADGKNLSGYFTEETGTPTAASLGRPG